MKPDQDAKIDFLAPAIADDVGNTAWRVTATINKASLPIRHLPPRN
jgi:hypothetical protein